MTRTTRRAMLSGAATLALPAIARAQSVTEISFYFPVAVGGPITKIIDGYAAEFQTGGGNFYLFKSATEAQSLACPRLLHWISSPERAARWGIDTGYVATRPDAWETPAMRDYAATFPAAAVARDQLRYAVAELSTHDNQRVTQALNDSSQAALTGKLAPDVALEQAQTTATRLLRSFH